MERQKASPEMRIFFEKLLALKERAEKYKEEDTSMEAREVWGEVYYCLDEIIKEKK